MKDASRSAPRRRVRRWVSWGYVIAGIVAVLGLGLVAWSLWLSELESPAVGEEFTRSAAEVAEGARKEASAAAATADPARSGAAGRITIPSLGIDAPVERSSLDDSGVMIVPDDPTVVGWLAEAQPVRADQGSTLIAGHVVSGGQRGAFHPLGKIQPGALIRTWDATGNRFDWVVVSLKSYHKQELPTDELASRNGDRRLALVTCGGEIVTLPHGNRVHRDNVVVEAVPLERS